MSSAYATTPAARAALAIGPAYHLLVSKLRRASTAAALAPIVASYTLPFAEQSKPIPAWFTHEARRLPEGSRVLTIPYPSLKSIGNNSMVYQAQDSIRFDLAGGYELVPGAGGSGSILLHPLGGTTQILEALTLGPFGAAKDYHLIWDAAAIGFVQRPDQPSPSGLLPRAGC